jgi:multiple sugar transport system substrate-binding protein
MKTLIKVLAAAALSTASMVIAAHAADLRVTVWTGSAPQLAMFASFADGFKKTHPDVNIKFETIPAANYTQKLTFQLAGGNVPDLGWIMEDAAPAFEQAGLLMDLKPTLEKTENYDLADFSQPAMGLWQGDGKIYAIPFSTSPFMIYFNKTLFDKAGLDDPLQLAAKGQWTMEKWREDAKTLKDKTGVWGFEFKDGEGYDSRILHAMMPPIRAYGGYAWQDGQCGFDKPKAVEAMTILHDMVYKDKSIVPPGVQDDFFAGNAAMTINQISRVPNLADAKFKWGIAPLPSGPAGESPVIGQAGFAVFKQGKHPELAAEFLAYMTDKQNVRIMDKYFPPARKSVLQDKQFVEGNPAIPPAQMKYVAEAIANGRVLPSNVNIPQISAAMKPKVDAFWKPDADPKKAMNGVCSAIQQFL